MTKPIVLFALQSPPLLQLLRACEAWDLRMEPLGDHEGLAESAILRDSPLPGLGTDVPDIVVVCSPAQLRRAKELVFGWGKKIPIVWAAHNGYETELTDGYEGPLLTFSSANMATFALFPREHTYVIRPHVPIVREHKTIGSPPLPAFTMQNRPHTRQNVAAKMRSALLASAIEEAGVTVDAYGQGQPKGFLDAAGKNIRWQYAAAYVSALPTTAGFGLAEHEALAHGCPLVTMAWSDAHITLADYPGMCTSQKELVELLRLVNHENEGHRRDTRTIFGELGRAALDTHYTPTIMRHGVERFVNGLL